MTAHNPFILHHKRAGRLSPIVFDNPHSGTTLPAHFKYACGKHDMNQLTDMHMEKLLSGIVGVPVLEATIHRAVIDLNRFEDEFDANEVVEGKWPAPLRVSSNTRNGFGLFPRDIRHDSKNITHIYNKASKPDTAEIRHRIENYYRPYHNALDDLLDRAFATHGYALHINMHSMVRPYALSADIILGDNMGRSCDVRVARFAEMFFRAHSFSVSFNNPYSGGTLVKNSGKPELGRHSIQIEIARDLYMDLNTLAYDEQKGAKIKKMMANFAQALEVFCEANAEHLQAPRKPSGPRP